MYYSVWSRTIFAPLDGGNKSDLVAVFKEKEIAEAVLRFSQNQNPDGKYSLLETVVPIKKDGDYIVEADESVLGDAMFKRLLKSQNIPV